jgi:hypothetical protein
MEHRMGNSIAYGGSSRRRFLKTAGAAAVGIALTSRAASRATAKTIEPGAMLYSFVNNTAGRWTDDQCFWSLDDGKEWYSFAKEPATPCPTGNGRVYFRLGGAPQNFDDRAAYWDFIEYAYAHGTWNGNTTQVDAFCIPLTIALGDKKVGITKSRAEIFKSFAADCPAPFKDCVKGDFWILSPGRAGFRTGGAHGDYFDAYVNDLWETYATEKPTSSGEFIGKVTDGAISFTPKAGGKPITCEKKPSTQDILLGEGVLSRDAAFCGALNRHVAADPADWRKIDKFYQAEPCNWYAKFMHEQTIDHKCYGFCYDDSSEQAAYFSGKGDKLIVTLNW